jgi:hypothetical protein
VRASCQANPYDRRWFGVLPNQRQSDRYRHGAADTHRSNLVRTALARGRLAVGQSLAIVVAASCVASGQALAQQGELYGPGYFYIDGLQSGCGDVETLVTNEGPDLIYPKDAFTIVVNGPAFDPLPKGLKLFAFYQTCGMMFYRNREDSELVADTLATRRGLAEGWMTAAVAEQICETDLLAEAGWTLAPNAVRCAAIYERVR